MMSPSVDPSPRDAPPPPDWPGHPAIEPHHERNLLLLAVHQIVLRLGWIFKTESVIMPAFLDRVAGAGWIRGCLPALNRLGQGIPPLFSANYLKAMRLKKRALAGLAVLMGAPFLALSLTCFLVGDQRSVWMLAWFLALYFAFFILYGLYLVSFGTIQGKLIRPARRGRLIVLSTFWGAIPATLVAIWLMPDWLDPSGPQWGHVFAFVGVCFVLSGLIAWMVVEPGDGTAEGSPKPPGSVADTLRVLREDANLRRLVLVAVLMGTGLTVIPHYQAWARAQLGLAGSHLMVWVVTQNVAVAVFSLFVGPLADRRGYRFVLRPLIFGSAVAPALAILLTRLPGGMGANLFWLVYVPLGITPLVPRTLLNYALEICRPEAHPRYQSIVSLGLAAPFLLSPVIGGLGDVVGFQWVFILAIVLVLLSGWLTFRLDEPRHRARDDGPLAAGLGPSE